MSSAVELRTNHLSTKAADQVVTAAVAVRETGDVSVAALRNATVNRLGNARVRGRIPGVLSAKYLVLTTTPSTEVDSQ